MIPREAGRGRSFVGAGKYYLHDKGYAATSERVAWTHTENVPTDDPQKACKWMAWTAMHAEELKRQSGSRMTGRPCTKPVFSFSLAWHPEQRPEKWEMIVAGRQALSALDLDNHETLMVAHTDRDHPHMHVIVNVIDPDTGRAKRLSFSRLKLSKWAEEHEREHGKIYCEERVANNERREQGQFVKYKEPKLDLKSKLTELYFQCDSGKAFRTALAEHGLTLAQGNRIVLVDAIGKVHSLSRQIEGVSPKDIRAKLSDIELPEFDEARDQGGEDGSSSKPKRKGTAQTAEADFYHDRDAQDREWQESIIDAGIEQEQDEVDRRPARNPKKRSAASSPAADPKKSKTPAAAKPQPPDQKLAKLFSQPPKQAPSPLELNHAQDRRNAELGAFYDESTRRRLRLESALQHQYGEYEANLRTEIDRLESTLQNSGALRIAWLKLWKRIPWNAEEELHNLHRGLENTEWRKREAQEALEIDIRSRADEIKARHEEERTRLNPSEKPARQEHTTEHPAEFDDHDVGPSYDL